MESVGTYGRSNLHLERDLVFSAGKNKLLPRQLGPLPLGLSSASFAKWHFTLFSFAPRAVACLLHRMRALGYRDMSYKA